MAKHEQNTDLAETWTVDTSDDIWVLGENALIEVGDNIGEQHGIYVADGMTGNRLDVRGDVTAATPLSDAAIGLAGARTTLRLFETSTLTATTGVFSTSYAAQIDNEGTIKASLNGIFVQAAEELVNSGDISGERGIYGVNSARIVNFGKIDGTVDGILSEGSGGTIINHKGGVINGEETGISLDTNTSRVVNDGKIAGGEFGYSLIEGDGSLTFINRGKLNGHVIMGAGEDIFDTRGGKFNDVVDGGLGSDVYKTASAKLQIQEGSNGGSDKVMSTVSFKLGDNVENLTLLGKHDTNGQGNDLANMLVGNGGDNRLSGGDGDDMLSGGAGMDILRGGAGDDFFAFHKNSDVDIVRDFTDGDVIVLDFIKSYQLDNFLANHLERDGDDLVITYGDARLILEDTRLNELSKADFTFV